MQRKAQILVYLCYFSSSAAFLAPSVPYHSRYVFKTEQQQQRRSLAERKMLDMPFFDGAPPAFFQGLMDIPIVQQFTTLADAGALLQQGFLESFLPTEICSTCARLQLVGETTLASMVVIAALQGALIMHQYASNPAGELIDPPGLTFGVEDASKTSAAGSDAVRHTHDDVREDCSPPLDNSYMSNRIVPSTTIPASKDENWSYNVNRALVFLLPWMAQASLAIMQYSHLLHIGVIMGLAKVYDFFRQIPKLSSQQERKPSAHPLGHEPKVMVIGDSMAVGIGCMDIFDKDKNSGIIKKTERLQLSPEQEETGDAPAGPVFPQALAQTLSRRLKKPVAWRSAGVDGGDTTDIRENLLGVIQEEVDKGQAPDVVVVLTGANDLKRIISVFPNSKPCASVKGFRSNLMELVNDVQRISPGTRVVFPSLPTYRLDSNSIMNVFPLSFFLDALIGMWDSQKIEAAKMSPSVSYYDLTPEDVNSWYKEEQEKGDPTPSMLAADGIHPNAKCYHKWASTVGDKLADTLLAEEQEAACGEQKRHQQLFPGLA